MAHWKAVPTLLATVLVGLPIAACATDDSTATSNAGPEVPGPGNPSPATCPATWAEEQPASTRSTGPLVPRGATEALLCSYPVTATQPRPVGAVRHIDTDVNKVVEYLNGLSLREPEDSVCPASDVTQHVIVLAYADRPPAVVHSRRCSWEQADQVRYGGSIKKITGFWGANWNE